MRRATDSFIRTFFIIGFTIGFALWVGVAAAQPCAEPPLDMLGWWPGDGDSVDLHSGLHATALNGVAYAPGLVGDAFAFDGLGGGQDDRIDLHASTMDGLQDFTVEMWVQSNTNQGALLSGAGRPVPGQYTDNALAIIQTPAGTAAVLAGAPSDFVPDALTDGGWHHVAYMRSGSGGYLYIDGVLVNSKIMSVGPLDIGPGGLVLGQEQDCLGGCFDPGVAFDGLIDELSIYDRALTGAEIFAIFDAGAAGKCKPLSTEELLLEEVAALEADVSNLQAQIVELEEEAAEASDAGSAACECSAEVCQGTDDEGEASDELDCGEHHRHDRSCNYGAKHWKKRAWKHWSHKRSWGRDKR